MDVYWCGFSGFGQLGSSRTSQEFMLCKQQNVTAVVFSFQNTIIFADNDVFIAGFVSGKVGQLKKLESPGKGKIAQVSCSSKQALLVLDDGECWQYLMDSESWKKLPDFATVEDNGGDYNKKILKVSCGDTINIALDQLGKVYSIPSPLSLAGIKVVDIACGFEHCVLLDDAGIVYTWGSGTRGQLGHGEPEFEDLPPRQVEALCGLHVMKISAGGWHSAVCTDTGDLYTWGWNNTGQLGFPMTKSNLRSVNQYKKSSEQINEEYSISLQQTSKCSPKEANINLTLTLRNSQSTGESSTSVSNSSHTITQEYILPKLSEKYRLTSTDKLDESSKKLKTESDVITHPEKEDSCSTVAAVAVLPEPWPVDFPAGIDVNVVDVACGNRHTIVLLDDSSVWGCGWNAYSQLGRPAQELLYSSQMIELPIPWDPKISQPVSVQCGAWNTAVFVKKK